MDNNIEPTVLCEDWSRQTMVTVYTVDNSISVLKRVKTVKILRIGWHDFLLVERDGSSFYFRLTSLHRFEVEDMGEKRSD